MTADFEWMLCGKKNVFCPCANNNKIKFEKTRCGFHCYQILASFLLIHFLAFHPAASSLPLVPPSTLCPILVEPFVLFSHVGHFPRTYSIRVESIAFCSQKPTFYFHVPMMSFGHFSRSNGVGQNEWMRPDLSISAIKIPNEKIDGTYTGAVVIRSVAPTLFLWMTLPFDCVCVLVCKMSM